eukprot:g14999.t1
MLALVVLGSVFHLPLGTGALSGGGRSSAAGTLIMSPSVTQWVRQRFPNQPRSLWTERSSRGFTISDLSCDACKQVLLVGSSTLAGRLPQAIGKAYMEGLHKVKKNRRNHAAFRGSPYVESDAQWQSCVTYIAGDVTDNFYEGGVAWSRQSASSLGFGTMRE